MMSTLWCHFIFFFLFISNAGSQWWCSQSISAMWKHWWLSLNHQNVLTDMPLLWVHVTEWLWWLLCHHLLQKCDLLGPFGLQKGHTAHPSRHVKKLLEGPMCQSWRTAGEPSTRKPNSNVRCHAKIFSLNEGHQTVDLQLDVSQQSIQSMGQQWANNGCTHTHSRPSKEFWSNQSTQKLDFCGKNQQEHGATQHTGSAQRVAVSTCSQWGLQFQQSQQTCGWLDQSSPNQMIWLFNKKFSPHDCDKGC